MPANALLTSSSPHWELLKNRGLASVKEQSYGKRHCVYDGPPSDWAKEREATHTLYCGDGPGEGTRPAKLLKTVLYVGVDEVADQIVWEKWDLVPSATIEWRIEQ